MSSQEAQLEEAIVSMGLSFVSSFQNMAEQMTKELEKTIKDHQRIMKETEEQ